MKYCILIFLFLHGFNSLAAKIRFPDEELASESVLPLFQPKRMVLDRRVSLDKRFSVGGSISFGLDEPFYIPFYAMGSLGFHFSESHGIVLSGVYFPAGYYGAGHALKQGLEDGRRFDIFKVPNPQMAGFLNYQYAPFYGKISLTKQFVLNLSIYGYAGPGLLVFSYGTKIPAGNLGIGQKLYINKWLAVRGDLGLYAYYGPALGRIDFGEEGQELRFNQIRPEHRRIILNFVTNVGVVILI